MKIAYPAYNIIKYNWDRIAAVLEPISKHHQIQVIHFGDDDPPKVDWCSFVKAPKWSNIVDLPKLIKYAVMVIGETDDFDLLYCWSSGSYFQLLSVLLAQIVKKPIVMHINGDGSLSRSHHLRPLAKLSEDSLDEITLNNVDLLIPISSIIEKSIKPRLKNPSRLSEPVPFTIDTEYYKPLPMPEEPTIGYAGRISPEKGFPFYFRVMEATPKQNYRVAGPIQISLTFPQNCHYIGCLTLKDMIYFYGLCNIIALPSYGEGMPASILEAYACGRPIICTPESRPPELPLFGWEIPHDINLWKSQIKALDWIEVQRLGQQARKWITSEWHTWEDFGEMMNQKFLSVNPDRELSVESEREIAPPSVTA